MAADKLKTPAAQPVFAHKRILEAEQRVAGNAGQMERLVAREKRYVIDADIPRIECLVADGD